MLNQFSPRQKGPGICLQKPIDSHLLKNVYKMMKFYEIICLLFSHILMLYVS